MLAALALAMTSPAMAMDMEHDMHAEQRAEWFNEMDSNDDGMLSRAEVMADAELRFNETDADDDGMLTKEEAHENKFWHKMGENLKKEYKEMQCRIAFPKCSSKGHVVPPCRTSCEDFARRCPGSDVSCEDLINNDKDCYAFNYQSYIAV